MKFPTEQVKNWFLENKREFPWRENPSPYRVWISEVMLQQTQADVVVPYFERWMKRFPTISALAQASVEEVIKEWEGLGYYARARNLHKGACFVMTHFRGELPSESSLLYQIPGLGPYTVGAILSFAFHKRHVAIDANVLRVITRFFAIQEEIEKRSTQLQVSKHVEELLPEKEAWILAEALIEFGATLCKKKPLCERCPIIGECLSVRQGIEKILPKKRKKQTITHLFRLVAIIEWEGEFLLKKGEAGKVMSDLYEFPYLEREAPPTSLEEAVNAMEKALGLTLKHQASLPKEEHSFTRYKAHLFPYVFKAEAKKGALWKKREDLFSLPFSSGHRRILNKVFSP